MINREDLIKIGTFNKTHGIQGELSFSFTNDVFDRSDCPYIVCEIDGIFVPFFISEYRFRSQTTALIKLDDITTEEAAREFVGNDIYFPKQYITVEEAADTQEDYFLGFTVCDENGYTLGEIVEVDDSTENILFILEDPDGNELLIPANDDFVIGIDEEEKIIQMNLPEGLLDLQ